MTRRALGMALALICLLSVALVAQPGRGRGKPPVPPKVYVRRNIAAFTPTQIAALRKGVQVMQSRPASDPTSWLYQANIHGTDDTPVATAWNTCQHGSYLFLSWHRMYLYYFERILRKASGDASFALPYWNYSQVANRALPAPFRTPTTNNPLFVSQRRATINGGSPLPATTVSITQALGFGNFSVNTGGAQSFGGRKVSAPVHFSNGHGALELAPHNGVHVQVGGGGWMSDPNLAARDPIFWLHHANIDRLWESWLKLGGGRANPPASDTVWMTTPFTFFDENGAEVKLTGAQILNTVAQLRYRYDALSTLTTAIMMTGGPGTSPGGPASDGGQGSGQQTAGSSDKPIAIAGQPVRVALSMPPEGAKQLETALTALAPVAVALKLEKVSYEPGAYLDVYVNLPAETAPPGPQSPHYAGSFAPFEPKDHRSAEHIVDITNAVRALRAKKLLQGNDINVTLVPTAPETKGAAPTALEASKVQIGRLSIVIGQ